MKIKIHSFTLSKILNLFLLVGLTCSCSPQTKTEVLPVPDFWVVLDVPDKADSDGYYALDFNLRRSGKYNLQIVSNGVETDILPELSIEIEDISVDEAPAKIFVLDSTTAPKTIFQFKKTLVLKKEGKQRIKVEAHPSIDQIRITPLYSHKLGFGSGQYEKEWLEMHQSNEKQATLAWFKEAKYGMFIHWGLYSQAGGMWKGTRINDSPYPGPKVAEWLMHAFRIPRDEYAQLANEFNPDKSFAKNIARLAKDAGMKYVVITSKHHDGFALFDSKSSEYDMVDATPYKADAIKELYEACLAEGLKFGVYYSHGNDWYNGSDGNYANAKKENDLMGVLSHPTGKNLWDPSPNTHAAYVETKAYDQIEELVSMLPELAVLWFDGEGYITEEQSFQFYKIIYDINPKVLVNRRVGYDFGDYLDAGDNVIPSADDKLTKYWETCGTTNNSWAYKSYDDDWKSTVELLYYLVDIASKGGNYLLNIGPDRKGHVPAASANGLLEVGQWLQVNGEAIYGTSRWDVPNEGQDETQLAGTGHRAVTGFQRKFTKDDFWFTSKGDCVYVISMESEAKDFTIKTLAKDEYIVTEVSLLGDQSKMEWHQDAKGLNVVLPENLPSDIGFVLKVTLK